MSSFFIAFRVLAPERRAAIEAVYAFCRAADDAVDDARDRDEGARALASVRARLDEAFRGGGAPALAEAIRRFELPRRPFDDLLEGCTWDLEGRRYPDREALRAYAYRVASTVGLLCVRIFGATGPGRERYAEELGIALQWTNVLRDVRPDLARGRLYLPASSLRSHGVTEEDLRSREPYARERIAALVLGEAAYARSRFAAARAALDPEDRPRVLSGSIMAAVYEALLSRIERAGDRVLDAELRLSAARRLWIAGRTLLRERLG
ncbi:MAG TPA: squalene/phytoene synthase family protein [Candidatus Polarisedimenticolaceae bacterium]